MKYITRHAVHREVQCGVHEVLSIAIYVILSRPTRTLFHRTEARAHEPPFFFSSPLIPAGAGASAGAGAWGDGCTGGLCAVLVCPDVNYCYHE